MDLTVKEIEAVLRRDPIVLLLLEDASKIRVKHLCNVILEYAKRVAADEQLGVLNLSKTAETP